MRRLLTAQDLRLPRPVLCFGSGQVRATILLSLVASSILLAEDCFFVAAGGFLSRRLGQLAPPGPFVDLERSAIRWPGQALQNASFSAEGYVRTSSLWKR